MDPLSFIKIRGFTGAADAENALTFEAFQGIGAGGTAPTTPGTAQTSADGVPLALWSAQQKFIKVFANYITTATDALPASRFNGLVSDYLAAVTAYSSIEDPTWQALGRQLDVLGQLQPLWAMYGRAPKKEFDDWLKTAEAYGTDLHQFFNDALNAGYDLEIAEDQLRHASTELEIAAAQNAIAQAQQAQALAAAEVPAVENSTKIIVGLIAIAKALAAGQWVLAGIVAIRIGVPVILDYVVKWALGKIGGGGLKKHDLTDLVNAVEDVALKDAIITFGDNAALHVKGALLEY